MLGSRGLLSAGACGPEGGNPGGGGNTSPPDTVPDFGSAVFTNPLVIDNSYLPFVVGTAMEYELESDEGLERTLVEVLDETREVAGVTTRVVRDRVYLDEVLIEDTRDWYAQDDEGNVWYMGEEVDNYHYDESGQLLDIDHEGSWEAQLDVAGAGETALPGFAMKAAPMVGDVYNQEFYEGEAEDMGEIVAIDVEITLRSGATYTCLQTLDSNPLDPGAEEYKYYAPGIGLIVEEDTSGGARAELVSGW
jgi:hypothetical protein